jgi:hypothetical protein
VRSGGARHTIGKPKPSSRLSMHDFLFVRRARPSNAAGLLRDAEQPARSAAQSERSSAKNAADSRADGARGLVADRRTLLRAPHDGLGLGRWCCQHHDAGDC